MKCLLNHLSSFPSFPNRAFHTHGVQNMFDESTVHLNVQVECLFFLNLESGAHRFWAINEECVCSVTQLCLTLCDPMNCSPPVSSIHGIFQASCQYSLLEWVVISYSTGSNPSLLHLLHWQVNSLPLAPPGKPVKEEGLNSTQKIWGCILDLPLPWWLIL